MPEKTSKTRQTNMELLRIVSMLMIITLHFLSHGGVLGSLTPFSLPYFLIWTLEGIAYVAVNCYVLISGYFLISSEFMMKKLLILLGQVVFFTASIYLLFLLTGQIEFSKKALLFAFIPVISKQYWFITVYVGLYILSPFLNMTIKAMTQKQHLACIVVGVLLFSVIPSFAFFSSTFYFGDGYGIVWFGVLYYIAAYIRLHYKPTFKAGKSALRYLLFAALVPLSKFAINLIAQTVYPKMVGSDLFYTYNSVLVFAASVALFVWFTNIRISGKAANKIILLLAPLTFGVYIIHDNRNLRPLLWHFVNAPAHLNRWYFPLFYLAVILAVFLVCGGIEWLRKALVGPLERSQWLENFSAGIENGMAKIFAGMERKLITEIPSEKEEEKPPQ